MAPRSDRDVWTVTVRTRGAKQALDCLCRKADAFLALACPFDSSDSPIGDDNG